MKKEIELELTSYFKFLFDAWECIQNAKLSPEVFKKITKQIEDFDSAENYYRKIEDCEEEAIELHSMAIKIAMFTVNEPTLFNKVFTGNTIKPQEFLNKAFNMEWAFHCMYFDLSRLAIPVINSASLRAIIAEGNESISVEHDLSSITSTYSEYDFYDLLKRMDKKDYSLILTSIEAPINIKNKIKEVFEDGDEEAFYRICRNDEVNYHKSLFYAWLWYIIRTHYSRLDTLMSELSFQEGLNKETKEKCNGYSRHLIEDPFTSESNLAYDHINMVNNEGVPSEISMEEIYNIKIRNEKVMVALLKYKKGLFTNVDAVMKLEEFIKSSPYFSEIYKIDGVENIMKCDFGTIKPFEDFKNMFLIPKPAPQAVDEPKKMTFDQLPPMNQRNEDKDAHYSLDKELDKDLCLRIYNVLVENELLDYGREIAESFMFRFSKECNTEIEPIQLEWKGSINDLYQFVYCIADNSSKITKKTYDFFSLSNGEEIKTTSAVKYAERAMSDRMIEVFQSLKKMGISLGPIERIQEKHIAKDKQLETLFKKD